MYALFCISFPPFFMNLFVARERASEGGEEIFVLDLLKTI